MDDGWCVSLARKHGVVPKKGDEITITNRNGRFTEIVGIAINDKPAFLYTEEQVTEHDRQRKEKFMKDQMDSYNKAKEECKFDTQFETVDISGFSGGYEMNCQRMLAEGMKFLREHSDFKFEYTTYKNITGIAWTETPLGKELDKVLLKAAGGDSTGAMHQAVIGHLRVIQSGGYDENHREGYEKWLAQFPRERRYMYPTELPKPEQI